MDKSLHAFKSLLLSKVGLIIIPFLFVVIQIFVISANVERKIDDQKQLLAKINDTQVQIDDNKAISIQNGEQLKVLQSTVDNQKTTIEKLNNNICLLQQQIISLGALPNIPLTENCNNLK